MTIKNHFFGPRSDINMGKNVKDNPTREVSITKKDWMGDVITCPFPDCPSVLSSYGDAFLVFPWD
jgi:hypothetical protein